MNFLTQIDNIILQLEMALNEKIPEVYSNFIKFRVDNASIAGHSAGDNINYLIYYKSERWVGLLINDKSRNNISYSLSIYVHEDRVNKSFYYTTYNDLLRHVAIFHKDGFPGYKHFSLGDDSDLHGYCKEEELLNFIKNSL